MPSEPRSTDSAPAARHHPGALAAFSHLDGPPARLRHSALPSHPPDDARDGDNRWIEAELEKEAYVEAVLQVVERIPRGRVTTYGAIADFVGGGPRQVGSVMARHGGAVPWWRVVRSNGSLPPSHQGEARECYLEEGTPMRPSGSVDLRSALWLPRLPSH